MDLSGRILYLTEDHALIAAQLAGEDLALDEERRLLNGISTDEITPAWTCYFYDETLARYCLIGLRGGAIPRDGVAKGGFRVIVSGRSTGCGSSRETAPFAALAAGVRLLVARSFEKIYEQNCQNIGLLTSTDFSLLERIERGQPISLAELTRHLDPIAAAIVEHGGLFAFSRARLAGEVHSPPIDTPPRPMTIVEKILAAHAVVDAKAGVVGVAAVKPGDALFIRTDVRFSHDYVTAMADALFRRGFGDDAKVADAASVYAFRDHLVLLDRVMPPAQRALGLAEQAAELAVKQREFAARQGVELYDDLEGEHGGSGAHGICHNLIIEEIALPGQVVIGTDSHTCMAGALGALAFGVGATEMACAWRTRDVRLRVPETVRVVLRGTLRDGTCAKDVMLDLLARPFFRRGEAIGKVMQLEGDGTWAMSLDERATLTNMAVEGGAFTGIVAADAKTLAFVAGRRRDRDDRACCAVQADPGARYYTTFEIDLAEIEPMVATPGDPRNGVPLRSLGDEPIAIHIAYGGSCTGGKCADMDMYARVLSRALDSGRRVADGVQLFIQFGSRRIRAYAQERGYLEVFRAAGATLVEPSCGACISAGPGISENADQVTVSAINRNFPGRSGPGRVYLASPWVVAASAIAGVIAAPDVGV